MFDESVQRKSAQALPDRFDAEAAEAHYRKSLTLAEPRGMRPLVAHCQQAIEHLTTARTMYCEMGMTYWLEKAEAELRQFT